LILIILLLQGCVPFANRTDSFYLVNAQPAAPDYLFSLDEDPERYDVLRTRYGVFVHRLSKGNGLVMGFRRFSNPTIAFDDESYQKLTIWAKSGVVPSATQIDLADSTDFLVIYSSGGSAWPEGDCSGYVRSGNLVVEPNGRSYRVRVQGQLEPHGYGGPFDTCVPKPVSLEFVAREVAFEELTPWLGIEGEHPYRETYR
jgi:hypothetical protein